MTLLKIVVGAVITQMMMKIILQLKNSKYLKEVKIGRMRMVIKFVEVVKNIK